MENKIEPLKTYSRHLSAYSIEKFWDFLRNLRYEMALPFAKPSQELKACINWSTVTHQEIRTTA
jgi:hypothetical protein